MNEDAIGDVVHGFSEKWLAALDLLAEAVSA
jgi:hypothetical protein